MILWTYLAHYKGNVYDWLTNKVSCDILIRFSKFYRPNAGYISVLCNHHMRTLLPEAGISGRISNYIPQFTAWGQQRLKSLPRPKLDWNAVHIEPSFVHFLPVYLTGRTAYLRVQIRDSFKQEPHQKRKPPLCLVKGQRNAKHSSQTQNKC